MGVIECFLFELSWSKRKRPARVLIYDALEVV